MSVVIGLDLFRIGSPAFSEARPQVRRGAGVAGAFESGAERPQATQRPAPVPAEPSAQDSCSSLTTEPVDTANVSMNPLRGLRDRHLVPKQILPRWSGAPRRRLVPVILRARQPARENEEPEKETLGSPDRREDRFQGLEVRRHLSARRPRRARRRQRTCTPMVDSIERSPSSSFGFMISRHDVREFCRADLGAHGPADHANNREQTPEAVPSRHTIETPSRAITTIRNTPYTTIRNKASAMGTDQGTAQEISLYRGS